MVSPLTENTADTKMSLDFWEEWMEEKSEPKARTSTVEYNVHVTFKYPNWDEKKGLDIPVHADSKSQAIKFAREIVRDAGHIGVGPLYFKATEAHR